MVASLAAILYVDDTDLLYRIAQLDMTDEEFVAQLQVAVNDWFTWFKPQVVTSNERSHFGISLCLTLSMGLQRHAVSLP